MFLFSLFKAVCKNRSHHKNLITAPNKKHASKKLLSLRNFICKEKCGYSQNESV